MGVLLAVMLWSVLSVHATQADVMRDGYVQAVGETDPPPKGGMASGENVKKEGPSEGETSQALEPAASDGFDDFSSFEEFGEFETGEDEAVFDPLSGYNRVVTRVNDKLYFWVLKPVARGYEFVVPEPVRRGIGNFFKNLGFPIRLVNNVLQLKFKDAGIETTRFLVNTTVGVAGLWDPAQQWLALSPHDEDFGQTLGYYGMDGGFHLVLPLLGPSNLRDTCGSVVDRNLNPTTYLEDAEITLALSATQTVNSTSLRIGQYEAIRKDAMDLYILLRNAYEQNREKKIRH